MNLELGNFKHDGEKFLINDKPIKLSTMRYKLLKLLCDNYGKKPVSTHTIINTLYYDIEYRKDEPNSPSYKVILHALRKVLRNNTDNKLTIRANKGAGYTLDYDLKPEKVKTHKLSKQAIKEIVYLHSTGRRATSIAGDFGISKSRIYDILIRNKQDKYLKDMYN